MECGVACSGEQESEVGGCCRKKGGRSQSVRHGGYTAILSLAGTEFFLIRLGERTRNPQDNKMPTRVRGWFLSLELMMKNAGKANERLDRALCAIL